MMVTYKAANENDWFRNGKRSCLRTTKNVKKNPRFQGNPLAGFYLTTIGTLAN